MSFYANHVAPDTCPIEDAPLPGSEAEAEYNDYLDRLAAELAAEVPPPEPGPWERCGQQFDDSPLTAEEAAGIAAAGRGVLELERPASEGPEVPLPW